MTGNAAELATARMDALLAHAGAFDARSFAAFAELQQRIGLTHAGRPLCLHLRPYVMTARDYAAIARASEQIAAALGTIAERSVTDPALAQALGLSADEQALAAIDPGYPQPLAVGRFDLLVSERGFYFIELNADSPAGIVDQLLVERALFGMPHVAALREDARTRSPAPHEALIAALREVYAMWGGCVERPTIALCDWREVATAAESQVIVRLLREAGHAALFVDPAELEYDGKRLSARGEAIDLVYRRVIVQELLERCGMEHALIRAYRDRRVCVANSFRTKSLNKKATFAVLSDPAFGALFSPEQRAAIAAHVPWTRRLSRGRTTDARGHEALLPELVLRERENLVLKPNDEYGGKGVLLGWRTSPERWAEAVQSGAEQGMIVQERRDPCMIRMPSYRDGLVFDDLYFDLCPYVFAGRMGGMMIRVSSSPVTNVSTGGEVSALLVIDEASPPDAEQAGRV
jgi:glutathionylspermidine synthase